MGTFGLKRKKLVYSGNASNHLIPSGKMRLKPMYSGECQIQIKFSHPTGSKLEEQLRSKFYLDDEHAKE